MGDAQDLMRGGDLLEFFSDNLGNAAADTGIDFIEEQGWTPTGRKRKRFDRQHQARKLAAGGDSSEGLWRLAAVRRKVKFDLVAAKRAEFFTADDKGRRVLCVRQIKEMNFEDGIGHPQLLRLFFHLLFESLSQALPFYR